MKTGMDLKVSRIRHKVTQAQVARVAGVSRSWVAKWERAEEIPAHVISKYETALNTFVYVREVA